MMVGSPRLLLLFLIIIIVVSAYAQHQVIIGGLHAPLCEGAATAANGVQVLLVVLNRLLAPSDFPRELLNVDLWHSVQLGHSVNLDSFHCFNQYSLMIKNSQII